MNSKSNPKTNLAVVLAVLSIANFIGLGGGFEVYGAEQNVTPSRAVGSAVPSLDVYPGLEATLFASEPLIDSPTNIDIDHRGRVWVCDVMNYRGHGRANTRPEGDRILILEDTDGDGVANVRKTYYQGRDVDAALGICVLGNQVIVTCAPNVIRFTDVDGDDRPDRKEYLFKNTGQPQNDHSTHSISFGPDGKFYWNMGNGGLYVHDRNENLVVDLAGNNVVDQRVARRQPSFEGKTSPYWGGMVFRCDPDGRRFEVLGHNFRNNYEVAVDSFGNLWQSDNDDDGNYGVRINFIMEYGNYGYLDERSGAGWREYRVSQHPDIPRRHWHQNDPGVVPNFIQTGAGSPTGITVYEGRLLPKVFWDQVIHCDAGPGVVWAATAKKVGAGFEGTLVNLVKGERDKWFRPVDVSTAPDGSLFFSDWYDPTVGWNRQGDLERGRIYRIAPKQLGYAIPRFDFTTPESAVEALRNPNAAVRFLAWTKLDESGAQAEPALRALLESDHPRFRARALWLLARIDGRAPTYVLQAIRDPNEDVRVVGLRIARQHRLDVTSLARHLSLDPSPQVRRECAIALRFENSPQAAETWARLANQHEAGDRWYLEALGIGADLDWDTRFEAWLELVGSDWKSPAGREIVWRSRARATPRLLARLLTESELSLEETKRLIRAFDFQEDQDETVNALLKVAVENSVGTTARSQVASAEAFIRLNRAGVELVDERQRALNRLLAAVAMTPHFPRLVSEFDLRDRYADLLQIATAHVDLELAGAAMRMVLASEGQTAIQDMLNSGDTSAVEALVRALAESRSPRNVDWLLGVLNRDDVESSAKATAIRGLAWSTRGIDAMIQLAEEGGFPDELRPIAGAAVTGTMHVALRNRATDYFPVPPLKGDQPLPQMTELLVYTGNIENGRKVFQEATCIQCHTIRGEGTNFGPDLSEIGDKLSKQGLYEAILDPSASISPAYKPYLFDLTNGAQLAGFIVSETEDTVSLRQAGGVTSTYPNLLIQSKREQTLSLMPAGLQQLMSADDLVDLIEFLSALKKPDQSGGRK